MKLWTRSSAKAHVIFDFDHTLVADESTVEVLKLAIEDSKAAPAILEKLAVIAPRALQGKASPREWLTLMTIVLHVRATHVDRYIERSMNNLHPDLRTAIQKLRAENIGVHIISGGYMEWVLPLAQAWGIESTNVLANKFFWAGERALITRPSPLLSAKRGKSEIVQAWLDTGRLTGRVLIVGDGASDYAVYAQGLVDAFVCADYYVEQPLNCPTGNIRRAAHPGEVYGHICELLMV
jgi:HAD superfamily phosphoserine phosphatase-like hydrolase